MKHKLWSLEAAEACYGIQKWGARFYQVNDQGNVDVQPKKNGQTIDLYQLVEDLKKQGVQLPVLIRFSDILQQRIEKIHECFQNAIDTYHYQGHYLGVYPIKVNPQKQVIEEIQNFGKAYSMGFEVGSKPELYAVLAMVDSPGALIICNGYKDRAYLRSALLAQKLNRRVIVVVEKLRELALLIQLSQELEISPQIGIRIKLSTQGAGAWESSGGEKSKFGLTPAELFEALKDIKDAGLEKQVELLHFHIGSQITNIQRIKEALKEMCRFYIELIRIGVEPQYVDVGGGLGVDYEGSRSLSSFSANYSIQEYANDIVYHLFEACSDAGIAHPIIISESGRALTAHHSMMVFDVLSSSQSVPWSSSDWVQEDEDNVLHNLLHTLEKAQPKTALESCHDAIELRKEASDKFQYGLLSLEGLAKAEKLYWSIMHKVQSLKEQGLCHGLELQSLEGVLSQKYYGNFSVFQSIPDSWAIEQVFPTMPIHRLNEEPSVQASLHDVTCDSDGVLKRFIQYGAMESTLAVHPLKEKEPYYIGVFLLGAYQEILGDLHNLFGDTDTVHIALNSDGSWYCKQKIGGEQVENVLEYVQFDAEYLRAQVSKWLQESSEQGLVSIQEAEEVRRVYQQGLKDYTYPQNVTSPVKK